MQKYKTATPPSYDWTKLNVSVLMFWRKKDNIVAPGASKKMNNHKSKSQRSTLLQRQQHFFKSNLKENIKVNYTTWGHLDFILAIDESMLID
jgi:hypothetical protein